MRRLPAMCVVLLSCLAGVGGLRADEGNGPTEEIAGGRPYQVLREFFAEQDAGKRSQLARQFGEIAPAQWPEVVEAFHRTAPFPPMEVKIHEFHLPADGNMPAVRYWLRIPTGYKHDDGKAWPLVIGGHGTGGSAGSFMAYVQDMLGPDAENYIIVCPDSPTQGVYMADVPMIEYPLRLLEAVRHLVNVDSNRTVLTGFSKGGYTAWGTAMFSPGQWGGAMPMASWSLSEAGSTGVTMYLENVLNLDMQAHWGENDIIKGQTQGINTLSRQARDRMKELGAKRFEGIEYAGQGHRLNLDKASIRRFVSAARRDPFPAECRMVFHRVRLGRAYYVSAVKGSKKDFTFGNNLSLRIDKPIDPREALRKILEREAFEIEVAADTKENALDVKAVNVREIEVELSPLLMDFSRPMTVTANGRKLLNGKQTIDWNELLETARRTYDFERLVGMRLKRGIPAKGK
ncbi:MAG: hypothetical protein JXL80_00290 [Planctomycetes bacterium]|nr:hypothetical protein [Planctomycetota bacterium]